MFTKQDFIESIEHEINICKHLHSKVKFDSLDYRPSGNQRSTIELMQYLTMCVIAPSTALVKNDWSIIPPIREAASQVTYDNFCERMDEQLKQFKELIEPLSEEDMQRETSTPFGDTPKLGIALVDFPLKFISSYKLQLFVNAKACGAENMTTFNTIKGINKPE